MLTRALANAGEMHLGNLEPRRDLTFVEDTAQAFLLAGEALGIEGETIHVGQGKAVSMTELARQCLEVVGGHARILSVAERQRPEKREVRLLVCDASKARRLLGWTPDVWLDEGLRRTADYVQGHLEQYRAEDYVV